jgi:hypothetical protein
MRKSAWTVSLVVLILILTGLPNVAQMAGRVPTKGDPYPVSSTKK